MQKVTCSIALRPTGKPFFERCARVGQGCTFHGDTGLEDSFGGHERRRVIYCIERAEFAVFEVEHSEFVPGIVSSHQSIAGLCRQTDRLQLRAELVGPEPRRAGGWQFGASKVSGNALTLLDRVLNGFEAQASSIRKSTSRAITRCVDIRHRSAPDLVDNDAVLALDTRGLRQSLVGSGANADQHCVGLQGSAGSKPYAGNPLGPENLRRSLSEHHFDAMGLVHRQKKIADRRSRDTGQQPRLLLYHDHAEAELPGSGGYFETNKTAANDNQLFRPFECPA